MGDCKTVQTKITNGNQFVTDENSFIKNQHYVLHSNFINIIFKKIIHGLSFIKK
jgi:hypothetical protein